MPRAHRYFLPGHIWHLTHRCHEREFLLKFARDRRRWEHWLFETRKRFSLVILNYVVTSNHIHLLVVSETDRMTIPQSMQLLAGRSAQEFNIRKKRKGAFWEDRYHATAVEKGPHLRRCVDYINLNMVRAGVVDHPREWECGGYHEIKQARKRYARIDRKQLAELLGLSSTNELGEWQEAFLAQAQERSNSVRHEVWTQSVAVGSRGFVESIQADLGTAARHRNIEATQDDLYVLREKRSSYNAISDAKIDGLRHGNTLLWELDCC